MRDHINLFLREVEPLTRIGLQNVNDPSSLSEIMGIICQHTEKKKAFGDRDYINRILENSITQFFGRGLSTSAATRESFQLFIKKFSSDQKQYNGHLQKSLFSDSFSLST